MPYYRGDYFRGDYYRGSIFSAIAGVVKGAAKGFALGGPLGAIAGARAGLPAPKPKVVAVVPTTNPLTFGAVPAKTPAKTHSAAIDTFLRMGGRFSAAGKAKLTEQHAKALAAGVHPMLMPGFGGRRRMNVTNVKALRRAGRRVKGFLKLARRLGALPVSSSGKKLFKAKRRKK